MTVNPSRKNPTVRDVAELAGTSTAVVSYVVNSGPRPVAAKTKQRVNMAIEQLGYRPNRGARALVMKRSQTLGLVLPDTSNAFFSDVAHSVEGYARSKGLITLVGNTDYDSATERSYVESFEDYGTDGIIVVCADIERQWAAAVSTPLVFLHRRPPGAEGPVVRSDDRAGALLAIQHLNSLGRGSVHCVAGHDDAGPLKERLEVWLESQRGSGWGDSSELVRVGFPRSDAAAGLAPWLERLTLPTSVFVLTDEQALGLLSAAARLGIRIPEDLAVVSYDDTSASAYSVPALTSVTVRLEQMVRLAVDRVLANDGSDQDYCGDVGLTVRQSCGGAEAPRDVAGVVP